MKLLTKYFLIVYATLGVLVIFGLLSNLIYVNTVNNHASAVEYDANGNKPVQYPTPLVNYPAYTARSVAFFIIFYLFPIFVIFMGARYFYTIGGGFFKSLVLPFSFVILEIIVSLIWLSSFAKGEEGMAVLYVWLQAIATIVATLIVNGIIFAASKTKRVKAN